MIVVSSPHSHSQYKPLLSIFNLSSLHVRTSLYLCHYIFIFAATLSYHTILQFYHHLNLVFNRFRYVYPFRYSKQHLKVLKAARIVPKVAIWFAIVTIPKPHSCVTDVRRGGRVFCYLYSCLICYL